VTEGRFDPTLLGAVVRAGYDMSFDALPRERDAVTTVEHRVSGAHAVVVDASTRLVMLPAGVGFDAGGIGKGFAADIVSGEVMAAGAHGACVNIGGDVRVRGTAPNGDAWQVDVLDPNDGAIARTAVVLADGGVVTSSRSRRTWTVDGHERHHLLDPATDAPVDNDIVCVTVVASDGWRAEALAKAAFVAGTEAGLAFVAARGAEAAVIDAAGTMHHTPRWSEFGAVAA
jgi:thiamine biosynthesis lipoprotein